MKSDRRVPIGQDWWDHFEREWADDLGYDPRDDPGNPAFVRQLDVDEPAIESQWDERECD